MLKITIRPEAEFTRVALEGRLAGPWVEELGRCWRTVTDSQRGAVVVDLTGVTFIDHEGKTILAKLWQEGAQFHAVGCLTRCIVEEITKGERTGTARSGRKDNG
jgi:anti-anti-sigma regulatory factor